MSDSVRKRKYLEYLNPDTLVELPNSRKRVHIKVLIKIVGRKLTKFLFAAIVRPTSHYFESAENK